MKIPKSAIVDLFVGRGDVDAAERADDTLSDPVDLDEAGPALRALGLNPGLLATQIDNLER